MATIDRTAIDTIKGYFYQFDYTIVSLLELQNDLDSLIVEGVEDVDIITANEKTAIQCKYYSKTEYNHSVIAKPIRLMLDHYKKVKNGLAKRINYKLYCFFSSGQHKLLLPFTANFLKENFLTYSEKQIKYEHHVLLGLTDRDIEDFISLLHINTSGVEYHFQLLNIFQLLMKEYDCSAFEAEHFYYNNALKVIKDLAVAQNIDNRKISKKDFITKINSRKILFNEWFIKYKGEKRLFAELRHQYFTHLNISSFERFFLIDIPKENYVRADLKELIFNISKKWSKISKREPIPFCPYIYLHNMPPEELLEIKKELHSEGFEFVDGFKYEGAAFDEHYLSKGIGKNRDIKLKFLNKSDHINLTLKAINKTKEIYQFYGQNSFFDNESPNIKHVKIQVSKIADINKII